MTAIEELVAPLLERLGETPDEVADYLLNHGCKGRRNSSVFCPVAHYLTTGLGTEVLVDAEQLQA